MLSLKFNHELLTQDIYLSLNVKVYLKTKSLKPKLKLTLNSKLKMYP
jgi:hypothetical protein